MEQHSCLSFAIDCDVLWKGLGVTIAGFILFVGSVYLLLAAIFGRWMGYLVLAVAFFGWMTIQSGLWLFGFWSQGPDTKTNLGPRGPDATWVVDAAGLDPGAVHDELAAYPSGEYPEPDTTDPTVEADVQQAQGVVAAYMAKQANEQLGLDPTAFDSILSTQIVVDDLRFATAADGTRLAVAQSHYSAMFLAISLILLLVHIPLLDRAERTRKEFLVGGSAPPWYGPA